MVIMNIVSTFQEKRMFIGIQNYSEDAIELKSLKQGSSLFFQNGSEIRV